mgnify:CR=1 FL=1
MTGRIRSSHGYVLVRRPDHPSADSRGYVYEHRMIVEEREGRLLSSSEQVHHINGVKDDNRPENLHLCESVAEHKKLHRAPGPRRGNAKLRVLSCCDCGRERKVWEKLSAEALTRRYPRCKSCAVRLWQAQRRPA